MSGNICDVCGNQPSIGVAASTCGPVSFAYCQSCASAGAEPYYALVAYLSMAVGKGEDLRPEAEMIHAGYQSIIDASLVVADKTRTDFYADVQREIDDYIAAMAEVSAQ